MKKKPLNSIEGYASYWRNPVGWIWIILPLLFVACGDRSNQNGTGQLTAVDINQAVFSKPVIESNKAIDGFIASEPSIANFHQMTNDIHSLKTLKQIKSKQLILFVPEDAAFEKLGKEEKEKLLAKTALNQRHQLFKNSLVLHDKKQGEWSGPGKTYGDSPINLNIKAGTVSIQNKEARILKQIVLKGGHLLYVIDMILG